MAPWPSSRSPIPAPNLDDPDWLTLEEAGDHARVTDGRLLTGRPSRCTMPVIQGGAGVQLRSGSEW
jgi:hypothetical protein